MIEPDPGPPQRAPTRSAAAQRVARVLAARASERILPQRGYDVPRTPQAVTTEWLTRALCGAAPGARVESIARARASSGTTSREALVLTYNAAGVEAALPNRLFVKCTATVAQRLMLGLGGLIAGEPCFYARIRPTLEIEAPQGYFAALDDSSWRSVVVIEDVVSTRGATFWTPAARTTRAEIEDLLGNVASWHGSLWNSRRLFDLGSLRTPAQQMALIDSLIGLADRRAAGVKRARGVIAPRLRTRQRDLYEGMRRAMRALSSGPHTYLHGDLHAANTYLTREGRVGAADWQVGLRGCWAYDVGYILATALDVEDRRELEEDLLAFYLDRLAAAGGQPPASAEAWLAYRKAAFYPYFAWLYTIGRSRLQPRFQPEEVSLLMIERISAAIDDLESLAAVGL